MSYEYRDEILNHIDIEPNCNYQIDTDRYYAKLKELNEVYAKAEAFDRILEEMDSAGKIMYKKESLVRYAVDNAFWNIDGIIVDYESGEDNE